MNRRIALALILALLMRTFVPGIALAMWSDSTGPQTLLICTGDGIKQIVVDRGASEPAPQIQHSCPCGVLCGGAVLPPDRFVTRVVYIATARFGPPDQGVAPGPIRAPLRHQVRAPPSSRCTVV